FWDIADRSVRRTVPLERETIAPSGVNASADCRRVYLREKDGSVSVWDTFTGRNVCHVRGSWRENSAARFSPDGALIVISVDDGEIVVWDLESNRLRHRFRAHGAAVNRLAFSEDGQRLATAGEDGLIKLWNTRDWSQAGAFSGH